ncbi:hypothetical protein [Burkholderia pseudomallei]|uniref:hypothetical protein n=1 Tax=Burkholderia pseudomallei TaxID=28450 RepID=UPI00347AAA26
MSLVQLVAQQLLEPVADFERGHRPKRNILSRSHRAKGLLKTMVDSVSKHPFGGLPAVG